LEQLEEVRRSAAVLRRPFRLPPGEYRLEVAARTQDGRTSVDARPVQVRPPAGGLDPSSLVVVRRTEEAGAGSEDDPLRVGRLRLVPNLDAPLSKAATPQIGLYVALRPVPEEEGPPVLSVEVRQGRRTVARAAPELPRPEPDGSIRLVVALPAASFPPGSYVVVLTARQGAVEVRREAIVRLVP
jgi:hypothetical protein